MRSPTTTHDAAGSEAAALDLERALTTRQMCELLGIAENTAAHWRLIGEGPRWFRAGGRSVRYTLRDVLAYRDARAVGRAQP